MNTTTLIIVIAGTMVLICLIQLGMQHMRNRQEEKRPISPIRVRAYERLALLLERTKPEAMIKEVMAEQDWSGASITDLQRALLQRLRLEYEHNLSQQVYVSDEVWRKIIVAREQMATFISQMAIRMKPNSTTMDYIKVLIEAYHTNGDTPNEIALQQLKDEARRLL